MNHAFKFWGSKVLNRLEANQLVCNLRYQFASEKFAKLPSMALDELMGIAPMPKSSALTKNVIEPAEYDLTVIVPAYNAERWLKECVDSILTQQTMFRVKLVAVDDGSEDKTGQILDSFLTNGDVEVIHQENKGHSGARNIALKKIKSKYVMFVDADDILLQGAIESLLSTAYRNNADIVEGAAYAFNETGFLYEYKKKDADNTRDNLIGTPWAKVIKSTLFSNLEFPEGYLYEDTIVKALLVPQAKIISTISECVYGYRIHPESITQKHTSELNRLDSFWIMVLMHQNMKELEIDIDYDSYLLTMGHIVFTYRRCILLPDEIKKDVFILTCDFVEKNYASYWNIKDKYYKLSKSLQEKDFGRYCVFCKFFRF